MENPKFENIKPEYLKPQLSTKLYKNCYTYLQAHYSARIFDEACQELNIPKNYLLSNHNWISVEFGKKFSSVIREKTGDSEIYRKIGQKYVSAETFNAVDYTILKNLSPGIVLNIMKRNYRHSNAVCELQIERPAWGHLKFILKSREPLYSDLIQNTLGVLDSLKNVFNLKSFSCKAIYDLATNPLEVTLHVRYSASAFLFRRLQKIAQYMVLAAAIGYGLEQLQSLLGFKILPLLGILVFTGSVLFAKLYKSMKQLQKTDDDLHAKNIQKDNTIYEKVEQLERQFNEANLLKQLSGKLISRLEPTRVLDETLRACHEHFNFSRVAVFLNSPKRKRLYLGSSLGFQLDGQVRAIEFLYPNPNAKNGFFAAVLDSGTSALITDVEEYKANLRLENRALVEALNVGSMILVPLQSQKNKFGVLVVVRNVGDQVLSQSEVSLAENIGSIFSLYFDNALNLENESKLRKVFQKYVPKQVLDSIIDSQYLGTGTLQPKRHMIVSFFADLRGFTAATENIPAEDVFKLVNIYCTFLTDKLAKFGAVIDNIIGDQIVCFFSPQSSLDTKYVENSFLALSSIIGEVATFQNELTQAGYPALRFGIGMNYGEASIGSVGTEEKMNFTALGTTVNLAARLQAVCKRYHSGLVVACLSKNYVEALGYGADTKYESKVLRGSTESTEFLVTTNLNFQQVFKNHGKAS